MRSGRVLALTGGLALGTASLLGPGAHPGPARPARAERARGATRRSPAGGAGRAVDAAAFAPGACELFPPTVGDRHTVVFLDAGHGGIDPGGVGTTESGQTVTEASVTLPVELDTMALLRADGYSVVVSRTRDTTVVRLAADDVANQVLTLLGSHDDVVARAQCANKAHAAILVGIYFDAGDSASYAGSITAYDAARPFWKRSARLAELVQSDVLTAMNAQGWAIPDDGAVPDNTLGSLVPTDPTGTGLAAEAAAYDHLLLLGPPSPGYLTTPSRMPGALIEPLYLTDPFEATLAASGAGQGIIAQGLARAVEQYFAPTPHPAPSTTTPTTATDAAPAGTS